ncbi:DHS-like NAD/FAD-binding domain-containing protein [Schizopora paradoxa]|uniref:DHS-like NAD/FAD-binding domain-containing protein n=1 Tax=Schizopora paradoxa TaxID=27342 RepID=A0A0H2RNG7_9AGAM|nr:DHS-like NAD/FAD-binding domain-containing protein [Schizopora paradoxa]
MTGRRSGHGSFSPSCSHSSSSRGRPPSPPSTTMISSLPLSSSSTDPTVRHALSNLSLAVAKSKKIVIVTGAGISCSCGVPYFRSSDGLYNLVKQQYPDIVLKGRDLFDASLFRDATSASVFYTFIAKLKQSIDSVEPSRTHHFIKTLDNKGKLLRSYTQNINGLEERVGLVGSSSSIKSKGKMKAKDVRNVEEYTAAFIQGVAPDCPDCASRSEARVARSARAIRIGTLHPAIVLYDEPHPLGDDIGSMESSDLSRIPDLLIIMGTSLKVHGLKKLVKEFSKAVHATGASPPSTEPSSSEEAKKPRKSKNPSMKGSSLNVKYHL